MLNAGRCNRSWFGMPVFAIDVYCEIYIIGRFAPSVAIHHQFTIAVWEIAIRF
jgi:hypothetical protein